MIVGNPRICFASACGDADSLAIMTQQDNAKDIKRYSRLQFSSQAGIVGFCSAPFVSTGNDTCNTLNNGGFFYSGCLYLRLYLLPLSSCRSGPRSPRLWSESSLVLCCQLPKYNTSDKTEQWHAHCRTRYTTMFICLYTMPLWY